MNDVRYMAPSAVAPPRGRARVRLWVRATRPGYVLTSLAPGLAGGLVAIRTAHAKWWLLPAALSALVLIHLATNASNDVEDGARGVDPPDKIANSGVFNNGLLSTTEGRWLYGALFVVPTLIGIGICVIQGPGLLVIGVLGILGGLFYTVGPQPYKYIGLGDPIIVLLLGPLVTQGTYTAVTGATFDASAFWVGLVPGLTVTSVVAANNLCDLDGDRAAGVRTLAVRLGFHGGRLLYATELLGGTCVPLILWATGLFNAWILLPLAVLPFALARCRQAFSATSSTDPALQTLTPLTAQLHLLMCGLLCAAIILDRL